MLRHPIEGRIYAVRWLPFPFVSKALNNAELVGYNCLETPPSGSATSGSLLLRERRHIKKNRFAPLLQPWGMG
jgi:hypothetical protein